MSQWCNTCSLGKVNSRYESCTKDCPAFGKTYEELAEVVIRQREEIDALRWTNKQLVKVEKQKRKELWKKAIREFAKKLREKKDVEFYYDVECGVTFQYETVDVDEIDDVEKEMIDHIKE